MLIGIAGRKFHGKDTVAKILCETAGFEQMRFADPLKNMLRAFYRTLSLGDAAIERRLEGDIKEIPCPLLGNKTPRYAMQTLGAEWGRDMISSSLWVDALQFRAHQAGKSIVVSDVRFPNECEAIRHLGGRVFRVDAGARVPANEFSDHASETQVDKLPVDGVILNNKDLQALRQQVDAAVFGQPAVVNQDGGLVPVGWN